ncbi:hypothetical protein C4K05_6262 [Pseudomonas chlororaphis subsp. aureofaciens]|uniref:Uncharacterized protein n=1 Tax=Pseudomonas chlororaphis subsp. aureofaciens TaxID=587851 RepID=A0AAD1E945_9PSED|nr:hypothetical protein C4K33_6060 [Pseudomonas chlororaphis subsp. piscium]AZE26672.1 hypothetical protein C4K08_6290 [Pseudomonas chlororaphis subsp. aureofaciens]AZE32913.1 hypothetical protein C4K07_6173 [Pseudomonas chlororaphis subsp. aureofaciens]AZE39219.1 hypothetical protein C4K06_6231 [Pseudomonas chlororaphis subsp. aureofaciens]AZE45557.1 hypothetical protein C4K05_6262 [Pseudomonas chlororaphis subsp. aureofaciens]
MLGLYSSASAAHSIAAFGSGYRVRDLVVIFAKKTFIFL